MVPPPLQAQIATCYKENAMIEDIKYEFKIHQKGFTYRFKIYTNQRGEWRLAMLRPRLGSGRANIYDTVRPRWPNGWERYFPDQCEAFQHAHEMIAQISY